MGAVTQTREYLKGGMRGRQRQGQSDSKTVSEKRDKDRERHIGAEIISLYSSCIRSFYVKANMVAWRSNLTTDFGFDFKPFFFWLFDSSESETESGKEKVNKQPR